jgi:hypothetical protein
MRDAADQRFRPYGLPVIRHRDGKIMDAKFGQQRSGAQSSRREFLRTLEDRFSDVLRFPGEQETGITGFAQLGREGAPRKQGAQAGRQFRGICFDEGDDETPRDSSYRDFDRLSGGGPVAAALLHGR